MAEELKVVHARLNGENAIESEEIWQSCLMAGTFGWAKQKLLS